MSLYPSLEDMKVDQMAQVSYQYWYMYKQAPQIRVRNWKLLSYFSAKTYVLGTLKNRLNETVLVSTQNTSLN